MQTRGRGRPAVTGVPKTERVHIRLTEAENDILERVMERTGLSRTDVLVRGLYMMYRKSLNIGSNSDE